MLTAAELADRGELDELEELDGLCELDKSKVFHLYFIFGRHEKGQRSNQNNDFRGTILN